MRYDPPKLGTGFGLKAGVYDDDDEVGGKDVNRSDTTSSDGTSKESRKEISNVFDYDGCCLFSFIFVGYVSLSPFITLATAAHVHLSRQSMSDFFRPERRDSTSVIYLIFHTRTERKTCAFLYKALCLCRPSRSRGWSRTRKARLIMRSTTGCMGMWNMSEVGNLPGFCTAGKQA